MEPVVGGARALRDAPEATLLAMRVPLAAHPPLPAWIADLAALRGAFPQFPVIAVVPREASPAVARLVCNLGKLGVRAVLGEDEPAYATLRPALASPVCLARDVVEWLRLRRTALNPELEHVIHGIFEYALHTREVSETCRIIGEPESSARARFRKKGLPPPSAWHQAARSLYAALRMQENPACSVEAVAYEQGYGSHASLSRQLYRVFGLRPSALRGTLGWEWLLIRWQARQAAAPCP
jgi:AraC-like DNA-binding protein